MVQTKRTIRIVVRVAITGDGYYVIEHCLDQWKTMPYRWASREACELDFPKVVKQMVEEGYEVVKHEKGEVAIV